MLCFLDVFKVDDVLVLVMDLFDSLEDRILEVILYEFMLKMVGRGSFFVFLVLVNFNFNC